MDKFCFKIPVYISAGHLPVRVRQLGQDQVGRGIHKGREDESAHGVREEGRQGFDFRTVFRKNILLSTEMSSLNMATVS